MIDRCPWCGCHLEPQNDEHNRRIKRCRNFPVCDYREIYRGTIIEVEGETE